MTALLDIENKTREITSHPIFSLNLHVTFIPFHIDIISLQIIENLQWCVHLQHLDLSDNFISQLSDISQLSQLRVS